MNKIKKYTLIGFGLLLGMGVLSSCTNTFCSTDDSAKILYTFDRGITKYSDTLPEGVSEYDVDTTSIDGVTIYKWYSLDNSYILRETVLPSLKTNSMYQPSLEFFKAIDNWVFETTLSKISEEGITIKSVGEISIEKHDEATGNSYYETNYDKTTLNGAINKYGYLKFSGNYENDNSSKQRVIFQYFDQKIESMRKNEEGSETKIVPGNDFINTYKSALTTKANNYRSCIYTVGDDGDVFGMYGDKNLNNFYEQIEIEKKSWGYAWSRGFLEGLLIYPISYMVDSFVTFFAGSNANLISGNGWAQVCAILLATIIIRSIMMLLTLKQTLGQGKMQQLQPQLMKLQEKYPNANTNQYEKQRLAQEQMALYKKNKINPMGQLLVMILQFPIFICVWGALSGCSALGTGTFYNMNLSSTVWEVLSNTSGLPSNINGWWTAFGLIIIMTVLQIAATVIPMIIQRVQRKKVQKLGKNNAVSQQNKTMKIVQYFMVALIIVMGFTLPSAMGVYWIAGAIFNICQTLLTYFINSKRQNTKGNR